MTRKKTKVKAKKQTAKQQLTMIMLPTVVVTKAAEILKDRDIDVETYLKLTLMAFAKVNKPLALTDVMNFGKYQGAKVEDAVRVDPRYFAWLVNQGSGSKFKYSVLQLVIELLNEPFENTDDVGDHEIPF